MVNLHQLGSFAQEMINQAQAGQSHGGYGGGGSGYDNGQQQQDGDVKDVVSRNLASLLNGSGSSQEANNTRGIGSFIGSLTSSVSLDESKIKAAHDKAYNQGAAEDMSNQDLGVAAGKQVFDLLFGGGSSSGTRDINSSGGGNSQLAADVTDLFGNAANQQQQQERSTGSTDRGLGDNLLSSLGGLAQGAAQPQRQKGTFEKIVDLISKEVAKFMGKGNANQNDVAAAATQTFTQLMIKKKIYSFMGKEAPQDNPADTVTNFLGGLGIGGNNNHGGSNSSSGAGGLGGLAAQFLGGGSNNNQQQQQQQQQHSQQQSSSQGGGGFGALAGLAASALGGGNKPQQQGQQQYNQQQSQQQQYNQQQSQSSSQGGGGFGALAGLAASALGGGNKPQQQGQQQYNQQQGQQQQGQQQQGSGGPDFNQLLSMAGPMLSALGNKR